MEQRNGRPNCTQSLYPNINLMLHYFFSGLQLVWSENGYYVIYKEMLSVIVLNLRFGTDRLWLFLGKNLNILHIGIKIIFH